MPNAALCFRIDAEPINLLGEELRAAEAEATARAEEAERLGSETVCHGSTYSPEKCRSVSTCVETRRNVSKRVETCGHVVDTCIFKQRETWHVSRRQPQGWWRQVDIVLTPGQY